MIIKAFINKFIFFLFAIFKFIASLLIFKTNIYLYYYIIFFIMQTIKQQPIYKDPKSIPITNLSQTLQNQVNSHKHICVSLYHNATYDYSVIQNIITSQISFWKVIRDDQQAQQAEQSSKNKIFDSSFSDILKYDDNNQNLKKQYQEELEKYKLIFTNNGIQPNNQSDIQDKEISNQICKKSRKRPGRSSADPLMQLQLLKWIKLQSEIDPQFNLTMHMLRDKALELTNLKNFQASKGWIEKFIKRYPNVNNYVRRQKKYIGKLSKGYKELLKNRRNYTSINKDLEKKLIVSNKTKNENDIGEQISPVKGKLNSEIYFSE